MYLLDTNICIALNNQNSQAIAEFYLKSSDCYISTIVLAELYKLFRSDRGNIHVFRYFDVMRSHNYSNRKAEIFLTPHSGKFNP
ncbi:MAG: PIN domain-containing protein [Tolypothrix brevis GSE-NOS-MK-07-07A]|nr:PIN domain-containing protein [Tolypothrix brevis GSE-NOS-MK-07-07A]